MFVINLVKRKLFKIKLELASTKRVNVFNITILVTFLLFGPVNWQ